ncbi:hypothetical protein GA0115242_100551, partial [Streptomyces sp. SolWspMP-5a-2]
PPPPPPHSSASAATVPVQPTSDVPVPVPGPDGSDEPVPDRGPRAPRGPVPENPEAEVDARTKGDATGTFAGTKPSEDGAVPGTVLAGPGAAARDAAAMRTDHSAREVAAQDPHSHRGPGITKSGTETTGDRGPTAPQSGTETTQDRGHKVPLRRKPTRTSRTKNKDKRARSRSQTERQARELGESERQLVREVRPHVPALLERDGNGAITRVQLREIIRRQGLTGVGNDRLGLVLQELRNADITTTRSTAR